MARKPSFSERVGAVASRAPQLGKPDVELTIRLWNVIDERIGHSGKSPDFIKAVWRDVLVRPLDMLAPAVEPRWQQFRETFMYGPWHELYDIVEYAGEDDASTREALQNALEQGQSGYRFIGNQLAPITSACEVADIEMALSAANPITAVKVHLDRALSLLAQRPEPDFRNSMKESISAIESMVALITNQPGSTLGQAIKSLNKQLEEAIHPALVDAFSKLYGYSSDAGGIRHAIKDQEVGGLAEARWMLVVCSAFVNFLLSKHFESTKVRPESR